MRLFNTLTRRKEEFTPLHKKSVGFYTCGPTVYNYAHIGNLRSYFFADTIKRALLYFGYTVTHVMNITDVGHLTSDADIGEDKMLIAATREKKTVWDIAAFYTRAFMENIHDLNIVTPDIICKATDHIPQQIALVSKLFDRGFAYTAGGNVYFDTSRLSDYGKLAHLNSTASQEHRVEEDPNKRAPHDFVLWFTKSKFGEQDMRWDSPWGTGYPGWHIECSAMSSHYLGQPFDIHSGGIDHIPVHHTNEIAQSEAAAGKEFVRYWIHGEFLVVDEKRMGKSAGNFLTLDSLRQKGFAPLSFRFFCLQAHYRAQLNFNFDALSAAQEGLRNVRESVLRIRRKAQGVPLHEDASSAAVSLIERFKTDFAEAIGDDINTPRALALLFSLIKDINARDFLPPDYAFFLDAIRDTDRIFGLGLSLEPEQSIPPDVRELVELRVAARREKRWKKADDLRKLIEDRGFVVEDTDDGTHLLKK